jgi:hypothetical protein
MDQLKQYFVDFIRNVARIDPELVKVLKKIKIKNKDIIKSLVDLGIISKDEAIFITDGTFD